MCIPSPSSTPSFPLLHRRSTGPGPGPARKPSREPGTPALPPLTHPLILLLHNPSHSYIHGYIWCPRVDNVRCHASSLPVHDLAHTRAGDLASSPPPSSLLEGPHHILVYGRTRPLPTRRPISDNLEIWTDRRMLLCSEAYHVPPPPPSLSFLLRNVISAPIASYKQVQAKRNPWRYISEIHPSFLCRMSVCAAQFSSYPSSPTYHLHTYLLYTQRITRFLPSGSRLQRPARVPPRPANWRVATDEISHVISSHVIAGLGQPPLMVRSNKGGSSSSQLCLNHQLLHLRRSDGRGRFYFQHHARHQKKRGNRPSRRITTALVQVAAP